MVTDRSGLDATRRPFEQASSTASPSPPMSTSASPTTSPLKFGAIADQSCTPLSMDDSDEFLSSPRRDCLRAPKADNRIRSFGQDERIEQSTGESMATTLAVRGTGGAKSSTSVTPLSPASAHVTAGDSREVSVPASTKQDCKALSQSVTVPSSVPNVKTPSYQKPSLPRNLPQALSTSIPRDLPPFIRTASNSSVTIQHPTPDLNTRSGAYVSNIAVLEASAERLSSTTSSIEEAIRWEHNELKRTDSERSSMLRARLASESSASGSAPAPPSTTSRRSSIIGINTAARSGGYSPAGYVMSPAYSFSNASSRHRSASKTSSAGVQSPLVTNPETFTAAAPVATLGKEAPAQCLSNWGRRRPSIRSVRSTVSDKLSLAAMAEVEPTSLTRDALDEADRAIAYGQAPEDDEVIRAIARQRYASEFIDDDEDLSTWHAGPTTLVQRASVRHAPAHAPQVHGWQHQPHKDQSSERKRPATSGSGSSSRKTQDAFDDFDGVHCTLEITDHPGSMAPPRRTSDSQEAAATGNDAPMAGHTTVALPRQGPRTARPSSYFDPSNGHEMLYYPARVPAMLNLPPKLSKNPRNTMTAGKRRSQALSAVMDPDSVHAQDPARESWLPGLLEHLREHNEPEYLGQAVLGGGRVQHVEYAAQPSDHNTGDANRGRLQLGSTNSNGCTPTQPPELRRPARLTSKRKTRDLTALQGLPPQLRASAFFDAQPQQRIEIMDGSATHTLDSILNASAAAPVSAFTDHAFAGKLGNEVYGLEKRSGKKAQKEPEAEITPPPRTGPNKLLKRASRDVLGSGQTHKKQASFLSLLSTKVRDEETALAEARTRPFAEEDDHSQEDADEYQLAPSSPEEDEDERDAHYQGAPTTLLAELLLRKQEQKLRTRPAQKAYPKGMHSTLLDIDAVHEQQRKDRQARRVNLAWEESAAVDEDDDDDEDVPLALLAAAKTGATGGKKRFTMDISAVMDEVNRPLGLMERRGLEDNEPLSRRRDRLQGRQSAAVNLTMVQARTSTLNLANGQLPALPQHMSGRGGSSGPVSPVDPDFDEHEMEDETLAARRQRLASENPLPRARPVSGSFSVEVLAQFTGVDQEKGPNHNVAPHPASSNTPVPEEEETLGQRRRRLQAEREAREREMGSSSRPAPHQERPAYNAAAPWQQQQQSIPRGSVYAHGGGVPPAGQVYGNTGYAGMGRVSIPMQMGMMNSAYADHAMPGVVRTGHADSVERWRQSVLPG